MLKVDYTVADGKPTLTNAPALLFVQRQGRQAARLGMIVLHDDAQRELAHGPAAAQRDRHVGAFTQALYDDAKKQGWPVISIKNDWKRVFAFE